MTWKIPRQMIQSHSSWKIPILMSLMSLVICFGFWIDKNMQKSTFPHQKMWWNSGAGQRVETDTAKRSAEGPDRTILSGIRWPIFLGTSGNSRHLVFCWGATRGSGVWKDPGSAWSWSSPACHYPSQIASPRPNGSAVQQVGIWMSNAQKNCQNWANGSSSQIKCLYLVCWTQLYRGFHTLMESASLSHFGKHGSMSILGKQA